MTTILALATRQAEQTIPLLSDALGHRGARLMVLHTETFPTESMLDATLGPGGYRGALTNQDGETIELDSIHAAWLACWDPAADLRRVALDRSVGAACRMEANAVLRGVLTSIAAPMVNDFAAVERAGLTAWQLAQAHHHGLRVQSTHLTNRPGSGGSFAMEVGPLITRRVGTSTRRSPSTRVPFAATSNIQAGTMEEGLALAPVTLQSRVDSTRGARVFVVGDTVFATEVPSGHPIELPADVERGLVGLHRSSGLQVGGVDLLQQADGRWVFIEADPRGCWHPVHNQAHDVAGALADLLLATRTTSALGRASTRCVCLPP